jgi:hypothetical protein
MIVILLTLLQVALVVTFHLNGKKSTVFSNNFVMKWSFAKGTGTMQELGCIGTDGEYYFHPSKKATLKYPDNTIFGKSRIIPIFPYTDKVLLPLSADWINIYEMKHRQMINDVGRDGMVGFNHYNIPNHKLGLVGTLARIEEIKNLPDGRFFVVFQGFQRYYIEEMISEKPYLKGRIKTFKDTTNNLNLLNTLEQKILNELRLNIKV